MIVIDTTTLCRICLENGAVFPIFEGIGDSESIISKLSSCLLRKIEDIEGYPRNICYKCKSTIETICSFVKQYEKSCKILQNEIPSVKTERFDFSNSDYEPPVDSEPEVYEIKVENILEPEPVERNTTDFELIKQTTQLQTKQVKVETEPEDKPNKCKKIVNGKAKGPTCTKKVQGKRSSNAKKLGAKGSCNAKTVVFKKPVKRLKGLAEGPSKLVDYPESKEGNEDDERKSKPKESENKLNQFPPPELCEVCGLAFECPSALSRHKAKVHLTLTDRLKCTKCYYTTVKEESLKLHIEKNHLKRNHCCEICGKAFFQKKILNSHIAIVHMNKKQPRKTYTCQFCQKTFAAKRCGIVHERAEHTGERPEVCSVCNSSFYDKVYLREHMRIHTGHTPFKCPICGRGCTQLGNLKSHMRIHRLSEVDPDKHGQIKPNLLKMMKK